MKIVHKRTVRKCPIHRTLRDKAVDQLNERSKFEFAALLELTGFVAMEESVKWDFIHDFIEEDTGQELIPVADDYFRRHQFQDELISPEKYLAGAGGNKRTAGYIWFSKHTAHLVRHFFTKRCTMLEGSNKSYISSREKVIERLGKDAAPPSLELFSRLKSVETNAA